MKWKTAISTHRNGEPYLRGHNLLALAREHSFTEIIFLTWQGRMPNASERALLDTILVASIEHGVGVPSAFVARTVASVGNPINVALAGGLLAIGDWHGGAIEQAARILQLPDSAENIVSDFLARKERLPGFGHKTYKDRDPRAEVIFEKTEELGLAKTFVAKERDMEAALKTQSGKVLPTNIDGAIAAAMSELGFDWRLGKALFALGRLPGLIAHAHEEISNEKPYRRLDEADVEYTGPGCAAQDV